MKRNLTAHSLPLKASAVLESNVGRAISNLNALADRVAVAPGNMAWNVDKFIGAAGYCRVLQRHADTRLMLEAARDVAVGACRAAAVPKDVVIVVKVAGADVATAGTGTNDGLDSASWTNAFGVPLVLRDSRAIDELCSLDPALLRHGTAQLDEYRHCAAVALRLFWTGGDWRTAVGDTRANAELERMRVLPDADYARRVTTIVDMLDPLERLHAVDFNDALFAALEAHKGYWSRPGGPSAGPLGLIAIVPLGLSCLALDRGIPIEVESDYIPLWLLEGA